MNSKIAVANIVGFLNEAVLGMMMKNTTAGCTAGQTGHSRLSGESKIAKIRMYVFFFSRPLFEVCFISNVSTSC